MSKKKNKKSNANNSAEEIKETSADTENTVQEEIAETEEKSADTSASENTADEASKSDKSNSENADDETSESDKKKSHKPRKPINKRKLKYGSLATAITVVFIAVIVLVNVLVVSLSDRFSLKLDLTPQKFFEISQETIDYLGELDEAVDIVVLQDEDTLSLGSSYDKQIVEVVKKYALASDNITASFIDMDKNPNYAAKYNDIYKGDIAEGNIIVTNGSKIRVLTANELYNTESYYYYSYITSSKAEQALTSAVMYVTDTNPKTIGILSVKSPASVEASLDNFRSTLESNGYDLVDIDLMSVEKIDSSIDMILIPAPLNDFTSAMTEKLTDYLYNNGELGKNVFYMANYDQNSTPNLDTFLAEWGIEVGDGYIYETDDNLRQVAPVYGMQNYITSSVAQIADEENYGSMISDNSLPIITPVARPLNLLFDTNNDRETNAILVTSDSSAVIPVEADSSYNIDDSQTGVQNVMVMGTKFITNDNNEKITSNVTVIGSAFLVDYYMLTENAYNNGEFIINSINSITGKSNGITILAKSIDAETITISEAQTSILTLIITIIIPLIVVVIGISVAVRRKHK
ncbi:MAG: Gldg family protein [Oscillospiraceae bacterium]